MSGGEQAITLLFPSPEIVEADPDLIFKVQPHFPPTSLSQPVCTHARLIKVRAVSDGEAKGGCYLLGLAMAAASFLIRYP